MDLRIIFYAAILASCVTIAVFREKKQGSRDRLPARSKKDEEPPAELLELPPFEHVMKSDGKGDTVRYNGYSSGTVRLKWVSRETAADGNPLRMRVPKSSTTISNKSRFFSAAGRSYYSLERLTAEKSADGTFRDSYGRVVVCVSERFPCFDSSDRLYEKRYFRWWLIVEDGKLTRVFRADESSEIHITEDVQDLEKNCVEALTKLGFFVS